MGAAAFGFRTQARSRWRGWLGRAVLFGIVCGTVLAAAAGARRTDTAYDRFVVAQRAYDVLIPNQTDQGTAVFDPAEVIALPQVDDSVVGVFTYVELGTGEAAIADDEGRLGRDINRFKILEGRPLDPDRPDEAVVSFAAADEQGIEVGDRIALFNPSGSDAGRLTPAQRSALAARRRVLSDGQVRIVGIEASPGEFPPHSAGSGWVHLSPALSRSGALSGYEAIVVRLEHGSEDVPAFLGELERLERGPQDAVSVITQAEEGIEPNRSIHLQATAFWILAAVLAVAAIVLIAQIESRATRLEADDSPVLGALGESRAQRLAGTLIGRVPVAALAAVTAVGVAVLLSPLAPVGIARIAEPDPGLHVDAGVLALGGVLVLALIPLLALPAAWSTARLSPARAGGSIDGASGRPSWLVRRTAALRSPSAAIGVRFALERGGGRDAVPVRSTLFGVTIAVAALAATATFGASLAHLLDTPRLYGLVWDTQITNYGSGPDLGGEADRIRRDPGVEAVAVGEAGVPVSIDGERTSLLYLDDPTGSALPPVIEGRHATEGDEITLGARTARRIDAGLGDTVDVAVEGFPSSPFHLVGTIVMPSGESSRLGEGALTTKAGVYRLGATDDVLANDLFVRLRPGTEPDQVAATLPGGANGIFAVPVNAPTDLVNFGRVDALPAILGGLVAFVAASMLAHTLVTAVRRRRRDLAVLKTLGLARQQVGTVVRWQALTLVSVAVVVGTPIGIAIGRVAWTVLARQLGVLPVAVTPVVVLMLLAAATVGLGLLVSVVPARAAARTPAATVLRSG
jgi:putative ABC transport system permease protein